MLPEVGKTYLMRHSRKGNAKVKILSISDDEVWVDVEIISGTLRGIGAGSVRQAGDAVRARLQLCQFVEHDGIT